MTDRENGYEPWDVPLSCIWVWKNSNGHIAHGQAFKTKKDCELEFSNCLGKAIRFIAPDGKEFKEKAKRWALNSIKKVS